MMRKRRKIMKNKKSTPKSADLKNQVHYKPKEPTGQSAQVLSYMTIFGGISSMDAFKRFNITRLSARIFELRAAGYDITTERHSCKGKKGTYAVYRIGRNEDEEAN
jgi:tryptophan synthase beta subunit